MATVNFTTVFAGIWIASPVAGLRPVRALRFTTLNFPSPASGTSPSLFISFSTIRVKPSRKALACFLSASASWAIASINSVRVMRDLPC